ncbi:hypothetical protein CTAYLR_000917 [Chrysophaeum taylorii]|uniref:Uncharacterized protein n=1 Tax=Chrysophaeum taylorii TaxID=2483200 RepID=A0AAD7UFU3_9STRA|nr:hypothetical protein CTAYLR_000917 [Chrysophaeum taylorii]
MQADLHLADNAEQFQEGTNDGIVELEDASIEQQNLSANALNEQEFSPTTNKTGDSAALLRSFALGIIGAIRWLQALVTAMMLKRRFSDGDEMESAGLDVGEDARSRAQLATGKEEARPGDREVSKLVKEGLRVVSEVLFKSEDEEPKDETVVLAAVMAMEPSSASESPELLKGEEKVAVYAALRAAISKRDLATLYSAIRMAYELIEPGDRAHIGVTLDEAKLAAFFLVVKTKLECVEVARLEEERFHALRAADLEREASEDPLMAACVSNDLDALDAALAAASQQAHLVRETQPSAEGAASQQTRETLPSSLEAARAGLKAAISLGSKRALARAIADAHALGDEADAIDELRDAETLLAKLVSDRKKKKKRRHRIDDRRKDDLMRHENELLETIGRRLRFEDEEPRRIMADDALTKKDTRAPKQTTKSEEPSKKKPGESVWVITVLALVEFGSTVFFPMTWLALALAASVGRPAAGSVSRPNVNGGLAALMTASPLVPAVFGIHALTPFCVVVASLAWPHCTLTWRAPALSVKPLVFILPVFVFSLHSPLAPLWASPNLVGLLLACRVVDGNEAPKPILSARFCVAFTAGSLTAYAARTKTTILPQTLATLRGFVTAWLLVQDNALTRLKLTLNNKALNTIAESY